MYDDRTNLSKQVRENLESFFGEKLLKTTIPRNVRLAEAPSHGQPAVTYDPRSRGAEAYREIARELLERNGLLKKPARKSGPGEQAVRLKAVESAPLRGTTELAMKRRWPFGRE